MPPIIIKDRLATVADMDACDKCLGVGMLCLECDEPWGTCMCDDPVEGECIDCWDEACCADLVAEES